MSDLWSEIRILGLKRGFEVGSYRLVSDLVKGTVSDNEKCYLNGSRSEHPKEELRPKKVQTVFGPHTEQGITTEVHGERKGRRRQVWRKTKNRDLIKSSESQRS